jgi:hypothetical protein
MALFGMLAAGAVLVFGTGTAEADEARGGGRAVRRGGDRVVLAMYSEPAPVSTAPAPVYEYQPTVYSSPTNAYPAAPAPAHGYRPPAIHGAALLRLDAAIRRQFAARYPGVLPQSKIRRGRPTDRAFDWCDAVPGMNVHRQGSYGTCWVHGPIEALEWSWRIRNGTTHIFSAQPILDRTQKTGGGGVDLVLSELLRHGTALATDYPYTGEPDAFRPDIPTRYRPIAWGHVGARGVVPPVGALKQALIKYGPLAASVWVDREFRRYKSGVYQGAAGVKPGRSNHVVLITGWDDGRGAWRVQNSWGRKWGEGGYMWIRYGANNIGLNAAWLVAQSTYYPFPADARAALGSGADRFPRWTTRYPLAQLPQSRRPGSRRW